MKRFYNQYAQKGAEWGAANPPLRAFLLKHRLWARPLDVSRFAFNLPRMVYTPKKELPPPLVISGGQLLFLQGRITPCQAHSLTYADASIGAGQTCCLQQRDDRHRHAVQHHCHRHGVGLHLDRLALGRYAPHHRPRRCAHSQSARP